jgi:hypothetical protein
VEGKLLSGEGEGKMFSKLMGLFSPYYEKKRYFSFSKFPKLLNFQIPKASE